MASYGGDDIVSRTRASTGAGASIMQSVLEIDHAEHDEEWDWEAKVSSITSSVLDYEYENGRRYHGFRAGVYPLPNDEKELDRLDVQHHVFKLALSGELYLAPLQHPRRVLDIGTGTGLWAIEMAEAHPDANIVGVDLSPVQPDLVPENAHFEIDDIESPWMYKPNYFDFIHSRMMACAIQNWKRMIKRSFNHLKPGGWMEIQELDPEVTSDDGTHLKSPSNCEYNAKFMEGSEKYGNPIPRRNEWKKMMEEAGFVDVRAHYFKIPMNTWPKDQRLKEIGKFQLLNYFEGYEAIGIGLFTRALGWTEPEFQVFLAKIRNELRDRNLHTYQYFSVVYGRKPLPPEGAPSSTTSSVTGLSTSGTSYLSSQVPRHCVPPVPRFSQVPGQTSTPDSAMAEITDAAASANLAESRLGQSGDGVVAFRINRNGEVIRMHRGESIQQYKDTFTHFTINSRKNRNPSASSNES